MEKANAVPIHAEIKPYSGEGSGHVVLNTVFILIDQLGMLLYETFQGSINLII